MILRVSLILIIYFGFDKFVCAQNKFDYNWVFGYGVDLLPDDTSFFRGNIINFNHGTIFQIPQKRNFDFYFQSNAYSDSI